VGKEPTPLIHSIQRIGKTHMGWVLNFHILITYLDDSNFIQIDYQFKNPKHDVYDPRCDTRGLI
jgi:hypothetical protein